MEPCIVNVWLKICDISSSLSYNVMLNAISLFIFIFSPFAFDNILLILEFIASVNHSKSFFILTLLCFVVLHVPVIIYSIYLFYLLLFRVARRRPQQAS